MRISVLTLGAIASIITTAAFANQVITSQTYVDNQDALKVNIAQGVGTNNANVGKTLVVNSQGNLELGAPAAGNYVEDSITDGVTNKAPSENAVHDALANKQNTIPATGTNSSTPGTTVVTYTGTAGTIGERGICNDSNEDDCNDGDLVTVNEIVNAVEYIENNMPTLPTLPTGTGGNVVTYDSNGDIGGERGIYDGSTTYNSSTDANKLVTAGTVVDWVDPLYDIPRTSVTYKTCTRWIDGQSHTDANCLLWSLEAKPIYAKQCNFDSDCANLPGSPYGCATPSCNAGECFCSVL